ncbi:ComF family protein [Caldicoprobacter guelmensis]|uniref:ComF family protein n=1 Tax=Caldicoprobacter guelmensis TaxID=1170224 RepID=UPI001956262E|nr:ComF family protein [Caldicoprobacter guelmensis]MBM7582620.1 ComF family protein [Caldicoprobacter guelmensis]
MNLFAIKEAILDILYPQNIACILCRQRVRDIDDKGVCRACADALPVIVPPVCPKCGRPVVEEGICNDCAYVLYHFEQAVSVLHYTPEIKQLIHRFKYGGVSYLSRTLGWWMVQAFEQRCNWNVDVIVPVPLHSRRQRQRGFNQSALLARELGRYIGVTVNEDVLVRKKYTSPQAGLSKFQRMQNLQGAFEVKAPEAVRDKSVLLIDDVFTTGSTVDECSRVLLEAGARKVYVFTLATGR